MLPLGFLTQRIKWQSVRQTIVTLWVFLVFRHEIKRPDIFCLQRSNIINNKKVHVLWCGDRKSVNLCILLCFYFLTSWLLEGQSLGAVILNQHEKKLVAFIYFLISSWEFPASMDNNNLISKLFCISYFMFFLKRRFPCYSTL